MAEDINTDTTGAEDESVSTDDNAVIKALRKQIRDLQAAVANAPTREDIEAEIRADLTRETAIADLLVGLGHPKGMSAVVKGKMGDAEVTVEAVAQALQSLGYAVEAADGETAGSGGEVSEAQSNLVNVTSLSAQVQAAASGGGKESVEERIAKAQSPAEVAAIMAEAGLAA